eukprot:jgi/Psemu1/37168/gm1.37168_g
MGQKNVRPFTTTNYNTSRTVNQAHLHSQKIVIPGLVDGNEWMEQKNAHPFTTTDYTKSKLKQKSKSKSKQATQEGITKRNPRGITKSEDVPSKKYNVMYYATSNYQMASFDQLTAVWLLGFTALAQVAGVNASQTVNQAHSQSRKIVILPELVDGNEWMEQKNENPFTTTNGTKERGSVHNHILQYLTDSQSGPLGVRSNRQSSLKAYTMNRSTILCSTGESRTNTMRSPSGTKLTVVLWSYASPA